MPDRVERAVTVEGEFVPLAAVSPEPEGKVLSIVTGSKRDSGGDHPHVIVDANHTMEYLKYAATRQLLTNKGEDQDNTQRLSSVFIDLSI